MKFSVFQKYFFLLLLSIGVAFGKGMLNTESNSLVKTPKSLLSLQVNHQSHAPIIAIAVCNFVEENENSEDSDKHFSFAFEVSSSDFLTFVGSQITANAPSIYHIYSISTNQKINILNCTFLI